jgi:hypothetical protein
MALHGISLPNLARQNTWARVSGWLRLALGHLQGPLSALGLAAYVEPGNHEDKGSQKTNLESLLAYVYAMSVMFHLFIMQRVSRLSCLEQSAGGGQGRRRLGVPCMLPCLLSHSDNDPFA